MTAHELTRELVARASYAPSASSVDGAALAAHAACEGACRDLSRSLGVSGFRALLTRALQQAEVRHGLLRDVRVRADGDPCLAGISELLAEHGPVDVAAALEAALEEMLSLLGRLIGDDMVARLIGQASRVGTRDDRNAT
ncbi:MAG: hypothetical protein ABJA80_11260 [bacterium]